MEDNLLKPTKKPFVFEFRIELSKEEVDECKKILDDLVLLDEDRPDRFYEFVDSYYKPEEIDSSEWIKSYTTLRVRDWRHPQKTNKEFVYSKVDIKDNGYVATHIFGSKILLTDTMEVVDEFIDDIKYEEFMRITKNGGLKYEIMEPYSFIAYLEYITAQFNGNEESFHSMEIELWVEDPSDNDAINKKIDKICIRLDINDKEKINLPLQNICYKKLS